MKLKAPLSIFWLTIILLIFFPDKSFAYRKFVPDHYPTIQYAIDHVNEIDTIVVRPGFYQENLVITGKPIRLFSEYFISQDTSKISNTIIDGGYIDRVIWITDDSYHACIINGFTIQHGSASGYGGGIHGNNKANALIEHCKIRQNIGGGMGFLGTTYATVNFAEITDNNSLEQGGGVGVGGYSRVNLNDCLIKGNLSSENGGGIFNISIPEALDYKFGLSINRCVVTDNEAQYGGGFFNRWCPNEVKIVNSVFYNNHARDEGHEIFAWYGNSIWFINTVIFNDSALFEDVIVFLCEWNNGVLRFDNCLVYGGETTIGSLDSIGTIIYSETNLDIDPEFIDPDHGDFHLRSNSPCIDAAIDFWFIMPHLVMHGEQFWISYNHVFMYAPEGSELAPDLLVHISEEQIYGSAPDIGANEYFPPVNIKEDHQDDGLQIYPNPASKILNIRLKHLDTSSSVLLFDSGGKLVYCDILSNENPLIAMDVSGFSSGMYFISCGDKTYRFIVPIK